MVPHAIVTVSLATAMLPRLSALRRRRRPAGAGRARSPRRCAPRWPWSCRSPRCCRSSRPTWPTSLFGTAPAGEAASTLYVPTLALFGLGAGLLHRPLPGAARLLRPRADPHGVLHPVRRRGHQHRASRSLLVAAHRRRAHLAGARPRLRRVVRRRVGASPTSCCAAGSAACDTRRAAALRWCGWLIATGAGDRRSPLGRGAGARTASATTRDLVVAAVRLAARRRPSTCSLFLVLARLLRIARGHRRARPRVTAARPRRLTRRTYDDARRSARPGHGEPRGGESVPHAIRAGDVLADRYRLVDLLSESGGGRFWRAHDRVLERHVALHVIPADDARADAAARGRAALGDRRWTGGSCGCSTPSAVDELCFVVNEWGAGHLPRHHARQQRARCRPRRGGLAGQRGGRHRSRSRTRPASPTAGWSPENVLLDNARVGADHRLLRRRGAARPAAGRPAPRRRRPGRAAVRRPDRHAGPASRRPPYRRAPRGARPGAAAAPGPGRRPARARRRCATSCSTRAAQRLRDVRDLGSARGIAELPGRVRRRPDRAAAAAASRPATRRRTRRSCSPPYPRSWPGRTPTTGCRPVRAEPEPSRSPSRPTPSPSRSPIGRELPTQAGLPIFDDENDEVSWLRAAARSRHRPAAVREAPERPLFAPEPAEGRPLRTPRPGAAPTGQDYWPWEGTGAGDE